MQTQECAPFKLPMMVVRVYEHDTIGAVNISFDYYFISLGKLVKFGFFNFLSSYNSTKAFMFISKAYITYSWDSKSIIRCCWNLNVDYT